jgi:hypothetical protein
MALKDAGVSMTTLLFLPPLDMPLISLVVASSLTLTITVVGIRPELSGGRSLAVQDAIGVMT